MASYVHTGRVVPLDEIISDDLRKDIDDASWAMSMVNGKTYMILFSNMQNILIYNKSHFQSCGLEKYISDQTEILKWIQEGVGRGWYSPHPEIIEISDCNELFSSGQISIHIFNNASFYLYDNIKEYGDVNFPGSLATSFVTGFEVFDNGDEATIKAAKDFIRFIYENEEWLDISAGNLPACKSVAEKYKDQITMLDEFISNCGGLAFE